jgi:hypothetical protein
MDRGNHYERAFEAYLQGHRLCYVAVDETRRAMLDEAPIKSLDFIVFGDDDARLLVDVKGRRFPMGPPERPRRVWECWSTREDVECLERWARLSGPSYQGLLVFAYHVLPSVELPDDVEDLWMFRGRRYLMRAVPSADYRRCMRLRSGKWDTVTLPRAAFRSLVRPLRCFTRRSPAPLEACPVQA